MIHAFSYYPPQICRILLLTKSEELFFSNVLQFLVIFVPTLLVVGLLLALFGFGKQKRNRLCLIAVNFITQGILALLMATNAMHHGAPGRPLLSFALLEIIITIGEALLYAHLLTGQSQGQAAAYNLAANICSAVLSLYLAEPVWRFIVSIS